MTKIDLSGSMFGRLTALELAAPIRSPSRISTRWICACECGTRKPIRTADLTSGKTKSCGCLLRRDKAEDIRGAKFGRLVVVERLKKKWICECECGKRIIVKRNSLTTGNTTSCGCKRIESLKRIFTTHGQTDTPTYVTWLNMMSRCNNPTTPAFKHYGGRGIKICERWHDFSNFLSDMGERPIGLSIEREDVNGDYEPSNCVWATDQVQANNKRCSVRLTYKGITMTLAQWARKLQLNYHTLEGRLHSYGWSIERAFETP